MAIKQVIKYQTSDGNFFDEKELAVIHENELHTLAELGRILVASIRTGRVDSVLREILMESQMVQAILKGYTKRMPKIEIKAPLVGKIAA